MGVPPKQVQGRRITASEDLEVLKYTVGGSVNINLVSALRERGIQAVGINGTDGELTRSRKREPLLIDECEVDFQLVGEIEHVNPTLLHVLLNAGMLPVVGCLTWSPDEGLLNINADTFAINLASALAARELVMLMEPEAVLDRHGRPVHSMNPEAYETGKKRRLDQCRDGTQVVHGFQCTESRNSHRSINQPFRFGSQSRNTT